ncbi:tetraacyldisaccharide 4'-kinase [Ottowia thiooxydans]|uniref:tetraacyldisaccharide 4'-kinase n=1 Tax=Ottowia thiooxydans TaxID=219182 RepID=UPI0004902271|nr:tetraacyldisaccharide 4'-kinase [Ottowia thiooxydans]
MRGALERKLLDSWRQRGVLAWGLLPVSLIYRGLVALKCVLYRWGLLKTERLPVPVIVVGNVIAGGAGKTPATLAIAEHLRERGWRPGIISRGYGRRTRDCREVRPADDPLDAGDEALLLRRRTGVPVFVAARRAEAGKALLAAYPSVNVLVCDDGLQHLALGRDVEVCVFDARGVGNGWLLPAGPLREPWPRSVDFVLCAPDAPLSSPPARSFSVRRTLAMNAVRADGSQVALTNLRGQPVTALAGIAQPEAFFSMLRAEGLTLAHAIALPDHDNFADLPELPGANQPLVCTEKDAAKLWRYWPDALAVPLMLHVPDAFLEELGAKLSSRA